MTSLEFTCCDVFTSRPLSGNPLAIVRGGENLSGAQLQAIAREFNLSETIFLLPSGHPAHSAKARIFTPERELPFAGHPTIGAAVFLAGEKFGGKVSEEQEALIVLEEDGKPIRVGVRLAPNRQPFAEFDMPSLPRELEKAPAREELSILLGLTSSEIGFENHLPSAFEACLPFIFAPVANLAAMARIKINPGAFENLLDPERAMIFAYCRESVNSASNFHARMFAPLAGVPEDPATGSAVAAFAGVIIKHDQPPGGRKSYIIEQGMEMGRPSQLHLEIMVDGDLRNVRIGGHVAMVSQGRMIFDPENM